VHEGYASNGVPAWRSFSGVSIVINNFINALTSVVYDGFKRITGKNLQMPVTVGIELDQAGRNSML
jgi:hypothetical protein